jgi:hypothetical protein
MLALNASRAHTPECRGPAVARLNEMRIGPRGAERLLEFELDNLISSGMLSWQTANERDMDFYSAWEG